MREASGFAPLRGLRRRSGAGSGLRGPVQGAVVPLRPGFAQVSPPAPKNRPRPTPVQFKLEAVEFTEVFHQRFGPGKARKEEKACAGTLSASPGRGQRPGTSGTSLPNPLDRPPRKGKPGGVRSPLATETL